MLGHEIQVLANGNQTQGEYELTLDAENLLKGVYYCKIQVCKEYGNSATETKKLILIK